MAINGAFGPVPNGQTSLSIVGLSEDDALAEVKRQIDRLRSV
jgi:hypothetical protein